MATILAMLACGAALAAADGGASTANRDTAPPVAVEKVVSDAAATSEATDKSDAYDPWEHLEDAVVSKEPQPIARRGGSSMRRSEADATQVTPAAGTATWARTLLSLGLVVGLIVALGWGYRLISNAGFGLRLPVGNTGLIHVLARSSLGPKQTLWLVRIADRLVLVGGGAEGLRRIDVIEDGDLAARLAGEVARARGGSSAAFAQTLSAADDPYDGLDDDGAADSPAATQVAKVRAALSQTIARVRGALGEANRGTN